MNLEEEKKQDSTIVLLIINLIIWIPLLIILFIIFGVSHVNAYGYYNHFKRNNETVASSTTTSLTYDGGVDTLYFRYAMDSNVNANTTAYFEVGYTIAFRFPYLSNITYHFPHTIYYWTTNGDLIDITNTCSESGSSKWTPTNPSNYQSTLLQVSSLVTCVYTPNTTGRGFAIEYNLTYGSVFLNAVTRSAYSQYKINFTQNPSEGEEIINNNNYNTNRIIDVNNQNTERTIDAINNINQVCSTYEKVVNESTSYNDYHGILLSDGTLQDTNNAWYTTTDYFIITNGKTYTITMGRNNTWATPNYCLYDSSKTVLSCTHYIEGQRTYTFTPTQDGYLRFSYDNRTNTTLTGEYCYNALSDWNSPNVNPFDDFNYYDSAHNSEMELIDEIQELSWNGFEFDFDTNSLDLVWLWLSRLLLENLYIKAMIMTLLCLGVIKLVLNR